jgi:hypothetical protein
LFQYLPCCKSFPEISPEILHDEPLNSVMSGNLDMLAAHTSANQKCYAVKLMPDSGV